MDATWFQFLPLLILASSLLPGIAIFFLHEEAVKTRTTLNLVAAVIKVAFVIALITVVYQGAVVEIRWRLIPNIDLVLHADALSVLFVSLSSILWLVTTIYAIGYLEHSPHRSRFFGFFSLCVSATVGIALAGNLITFIIFYELLTLTTYPLVVHKGTPEAIRAGRAYLGYTLAGGTLLVIGVVWLKSLAGALDFSTVGLLASHPEISDNSLRWIFLLLIIGFGVKAALIPLHGWLPKAMVAPAPVSALLHAVAVVKAGAFGIVRVVYDVYGVELTDRLGLLLPLALVSAITIIYGSVRAMFQEGLKARLAYSTISQVSYITLGVAIAGPIAAVGGIVHLVHQGLMKITLFFCAGNLAETLHIYNIRDLDGVGRRMPWTMAAFSLAAFGMIGIPPMAGFVSKYYLALGALEMHQPWILLVLLGSSALNAIYFLPIVYRAWFKPPAVPWHASTTTFETNWMLLFPPVVTALLALLAGVFAGSEYSPLEWSRFIVQKLYQP